MARAASMPIKGIYEVAIRVKDLDRAQEFYTSVLGLDVGLIVNERGMRFFRTAGASGMFVLQQDDGEFPKQHFAFTIDEADIHSAVAALDAAEVAHGAPVFHDWMPGTSIYFADPDGHDLELFAPRAASAEEG